MNIRLSIESSDNLDWLFILNQFDDGGKFELSTIFSIFLKVIITTALIMNSFLQRGLRGYPNLQYSEAIFLWKNL